MNKNIVKEFEKLIDYNEHLLNEKETKKEKTIIEFKLKSNRRVLNILKKYPEEITKENYKELGDLSGVGKSSLEKIKEILENGYILDIKNFKRDESENIMEELERVINIGRSKALELVKLGVKGVEDLKNKVEKGEIIVNDKILLGLKYDGVYKMHIPRDEIKEIEKFLNDKINKLNKELKDNKKFILTICGSYRRGKSYSNDIDILVSKKGTKKGGKNMDKYLVDFVDLLKKRWKKNMGRSLLIDDMTDNLTTKYMGFLRWHNNPPRRVDIRFITYDSYYTALLYFTGSGEFNVVMRNIAREKGYKLSEYSLVRIEGNKRVAIDSEKKVFDILGMDYIEPELR